MSEIKSALELALERTADVKSDRSSLEAHESRQAGQRLAGRFLENSSIDVAAEIRALDREKRSATREGFFHVMLSHLALPGQESDLQRLRLVQKGVASIVRDGNVVDSLMEQVIQYLEQYLDTKNQLAERLREQFEPRIRQREQQLAQQTGRHVQLDPASDPEFAKALNQNLQRLQTQYAQVIDQAKGQLEQLASEKQ